MKINNAQIVQEYDKIINHLVSEGASDRIIFMFTEMRDLVWKDYLYNILNRVSVDWNGLTVLDYGCKYGQMFPLLIALGANKIIGIDVDDEYVSEGIKYVSTYYNNVSYLKPVDNCYIPFSTKDIAVDVVIINEVISHINPMYLDTVLNEVTRVTKVGGVIFISDGNNLAYPGYKRKVHELFNLWENGPDGSYTDRDQVEKSYLTNRREIIESRHPKLSREKINYLAMNTSGLFGEYLLKIIDSYVKTGELVERPYSYGTCPVYPYYGAVMERSFYPQQVEYMLKERGLDTSCVRPKVPEWNQYLTKNSFWFFKIPVRFIKFCFSLLRYHLKNTFQPKWIYQFSENFQIRAVKVKS